MKTTISSVRGRISALENDAQHIYRSISSSIYITKIRELSGVETVTSQPEEPFIEVMKSVSEYNAEIARLKAIVARLNASTKLSNGMSIHQAIYTLNGLRRERSYLFEALTASPVLNRRSDGGMSGSAYYDVRELNFDKAAVKEKYDAITEEIVKMESEIDKLNSLEIEVEDL